MVWYIDIPILIIWISLILGIIVRFGKSIIVELREIFRPLIKIKIIICIMLLNLIIQLI